MVVFEVVDVARIAGRDAVMGRVCKGDLRVGTLFTRLDFKHPLYEPLDDAGVAVDLTAVRLNAYEQDRACLPEGISGGVMLEGEGFGLLREFSYLVSDELSPGAVVSATGSPKGPGPPR